MPGPWEKFQSSPSAEGPWKKFATPEADPKSVMADAAPETFLANAGDTFGVGTKVAAGMETLREYLANKKLPDSMGEAYDDYLRNKKYAKEAYSEANKENPKAAAGGTVANIAMSSALPLGNAANGASLLQKAKAGAKVGSAYGLLSSDIDEGDLKDAALKTGVGGLVGGAVPVFVEGAGKIKPGFQKLSGAMKKKAEALAENATGATRVQSEKFADNAGRELLDRKLVRFGDAPKDIAKRADALMSASESSIDDVLSNLDKNGVTVSKDQLAADLVGRISKLKGDESQAGVVKKLEGILERVMAGDSQRPLSQVEAVKRGFQKQANYAKPNTTQANKITANVYREAVEDVAKNANPDLAAKFTDAKKTYGLVAPIQEAAEKRASQLAQHPILGLNDVATGVTSTAVGGPLATIPGMVARRVAAPRISSSAAVTLDKAGSLAGKISEKIPNLSGDQISNVATRSAIPVSSKMEIPAALQKVAGTPYEAPLQAAAERGDNSFAATYYMMSQKDPEFRKRMEGNE